MQLFRRSVPWHFRRTSAWRLPGSGVGTLRRSGPGLEDAAPGAVGSVGTGAASGQEPEPPVAEPEDAPTERLARLLQAQGHCDDRTLERARRVAAESGQSLRAVLVQLGLVSERGLAEAFATLLGLALATPARYPAEPVLPDRLGARFLRHARALPVGIEATPEGEVLAVVLADPLDAFAPRAIAAATGLRVVAEVGVPIELDAALTRLYPEDGQAPSSDAPGQGAGESEPMEEDAERLRDLASEAPVIRLVNQVIARAVETRASDIHFEPFEDRLRVRYRYDGVLHEAESPPARLTAAITSRIKIMSRLDIAERRLPQDGRIKLAVRGQEVDFRVSTIPSLHGETVVLRVLDRNAVAFDYARLGLAPAVVTRLHAALDLPNGIVLVTGPTGSGKTTTLYTGLLGLNSVARKIVTVEDPIEYQLTGINQIQVKPQIDLTFATLLRSILRQDPDVIMVGEIRDVETAQIAVQAALTGHLVLSTVHTNSAAATITRLRDMGLEDYLMTAVLRGVLAQRLVRRLCEACRQRVPAAPELVARFGLDRRAAALAEAGVAAAPVDTAAAADSTSAAATAVAPADAADAAPAVDPGADGVGPGGHDGRVMLWHPVGCAQCRNTGFRGRQAIAEFLTPTPEIERLIFARADQSAIERAAIETGMVSMFDAGLDAALCGTTTVEEVVRSIRAEA